MRIPRSIRELENPADILAVQAAALGAVEPNSAVKKCVSVIGDDLIVGAVHRDLSAIGNIYLIGAGKAACPMADAICDILGERVTEGVIVTKYGHGCSSGRSEVIEAAHPVPDRASVDGSQRLIALASSLDPTDLLFVVVSGGASALCTLPAEGLDLADLIETNALLLKSGATITELNSVRKHLSSVKGGQLMKLVAPVPVVGLILSDVIGDPIDVIGSGLTAPDTSTFEEAWRALERYDLIDRVPVAARERLAQGVVGSVAETPKPGDPIFDNVQNEIVAGNTHAARAAVHAARELKWNALLLSTAMRGEAREVGEMAASTAKQVVLGDQPVPKPACLVWGGETTVHVTGHGLGGRNQELALSAAIALEGIKNTVVVALATDGTDGPTDASGAVATGRTLARARAEGLDAHRYLADNDAYHFFEALDDLILTGPTRTNVGDLLFVFCF